MKLGQSKVLFCLNLGVGLDLLIWATFGGWFRDSQRVLCDMELHLKFDT